MKACLDQGVLQSYFDGELSGERREEIALHLNHCLACSSALRELEVENSVLADALAAEFEINVPTERLRHRIDAAITGLHVIKPGLTDGESRIRTWWQSLSGFVSFSPQRAFSYATLLAVLAFATLFAIIHRRQTPTVLPQTELVKEAAKRIDPPVAVAPLREEVSSTSDKESPDKESIVRPRRRRKLEPHPAVPNLNTMTVKLLPGERSYLKTIAALDLTIKDEKRQMRPALQAEYERNLALVDGALAAARTAAKNNPHDPDAAEFMFTAYQSKVDLLNTVADARIYNREQ